MKKPSPAQSEYYEAKTAFAKAETEWKRLRNLRGPLWRENRARPVGAEPSEEFQRFDQAYQAAGVALSSARERLRLLQTARPIPKHKPFKYGYPVEDANEDMEETA